MGRDLVLWRDAKGAVACMSDHCIHRGVALSVGKVKGDCVECPFHGLQYDGRGCVTVIPANGKDAVVPATFQGEAFVVREAHGYIYLWWGEPRDEYPELPFIPGLDDTRLIYGTWRDPWNAFYTRAIENQRMSFTCPSFTTTRSARATRPSSTAPWRAWRATSCASGWTTRRITARPLAGRTKCRSRSEMRSLPSSSPTSGRTTWVRTPVSPPPSYASTNSTASCICASIADSADCPLSGNCPTC